MDRADVSVIVATFRREKLLLEAVASARSQRGVDVEVIVVDDSPEGSAREGVLAMKDARVRYAHRDCPSGGRPGAVRNEGVRLSTAPLLHFLDDDDRLFDGSLRDLAETITSHRYPMAFGRVVPFGDASKVLREQTAYFRRMASVMRRLRGRHKFAAQLLFREMPFVNSACMIPRQVFDAFGGYDETLRCCEDVELFLRVGRERGFIFVDRDVLHYRVGAPSLMNEFRRTDGQTDEDKVLESYRKMYARYKHDHGLFEYRALQALVKSTNLFRAATRLR
jgi:glycosyltransferase involved in cell wall biosynthesis